MNNKLSTISTEEEKNIRIKLNNKILIIEIDGTEVTNEWLEPVTDNEYNKLK